MGKGKKFRDFSTSSTRVMRGKDTWMLNRGSSVEGGLRVAKEGSQLQEVPHRGHN